MNKEDNLMTDTPKGDDSIVPVELWNGRARKSQRINMYSVLQQMREIMLKCWRINITKGLCRFLNKKSSAWKKLKWTMKVKWVA